MVIYINNSNKIFLENCNVANNFFSRLKGLMFKSRESVAQGLLIYPCKSIHTCFMRFNLDIFFISKEGKVLKVINVLKPWKVTSFVSDAYYVLELPSDFAVSNNIKLNDCLSFNKNGEGFYYEKI